MKNKGGSEENGKEKSRGENEKKMRINRGEWSRKQEKIETE